MTDNDTDNTDTETMSQTTDNTDTETNSTTATAGEQPEWEINDDAASRYDPDHLRRKLPGKMTEQQQDHAVAAIRNPDATWPTLAQALDAHQTQVHGTIRSWVTGRLGSGQSGDNGAKAAAKVRPSARDYATSYDELTPMQKATVDASARWYHHINKFRGDEQGMTLDMLAERIDDEYGVSPHSTYISDVLQTYDHLVERRRADEYAGESEDPGELTRSTPRILFARADEPGIPPVGLPDENLDNIRPSDPSELSFDPSEVDPDDEAVAGSALEPVVADANVDASVAADDDSEGWPCPHCGDTFPTKEKRDGHLGGAHMQPGVGDEADTEADHDREFTVTDPDAADDAPSAAGESIPSSVDDSAAEPRGTPVDQTSADEAEVDTVATLFGDDNRIDSLDARVDDLGDRLEAVARLHDTVDEIASELAAVRERIEAMDTDDHADTPYLADDDANMATAADTALHVLDAVNASDLGDTRKRKAYKQAVEGLHRLVDAADETPDSGEGQ